MRTMWSIVAYVAALLAVGISPAEAQSLKAQVDMKAPAPRLPNGKPDFSGIWARPATQDLTRTFTNPDGTSNRGEPNPLPFTPWGQAQWDNYNPIKYGDYAGSCMLERVITPWTGSEDRDTNLVYGNERDWNGYDQTKPQKWTGVIKQARFNRDSYGVATVEADKKTWTVILAPPVRMDFRGLTEDMLKPGKPGVAVTIEGFVSTRTPDEVRAQMLTVGKRSFDLR